MPPRSDRPAACWSPSGNDSEASVRTAIVTVSDASTIRAAMFAETRLVQGPCAGHAKPDGRGDAVGFCTDSVEARATRPKRGMNNRPMAEHEVGRFGTSAAISGVASRSAGKACRMSRTRTRQALEAAGWSSPSRGRSSCWMQTPAPRSGKLVAE